MKNRIGIVGGGQLARMMIPPAKKLGFFVTVLDPTPQSPAGQLADTQIVADLNDPKGMEALAKDSDFITLEWELANPVLLEKIANSGIPVNPSSKTLSIIKDKYLQKVFLKKNAIPVADFLEVNGDSIASLQNDIERKSEKFGFPFLLKAKIGAYDGKGNYLVKNKKDIQKGIKKLTLGNSQSHPEKNEGSHQLYIEKYIPFQKELAIMVARNTNGEIKTFPLVETIHKDNILHTVLSPAPVSHAVSKKAAAMARKVMQQLKGAGVFGIEMFLTHSTNSGQAQILVNEIAPRVHNSGHYTIEQTMTSQFEQHMRAISGLPLGDTSLLSPSAVMVNILGERNGTATIQGLEKALKISGVSVHIYGKAETKMQRKMGHITVIGETLALCLKKAKKAKKLLSI